MFEIGHATRDAYFALGDRYGYKFDIARTPEQKQEILKKVNDEIKKLIESSKNRTMQFLKRYPKRTMELEDE